MMGSHRVMAAESAQRTVLRSPPGSPSRKRKGGQGENNNGIPTPEPTQAADGTQETSTDGVATSPRKKTKLDEVTTNQPTPASTQQDGSAEVPTATQEAETAPSASAPVSMRRSRRAAATTTPAPVNEDATALSSEALGDLADLALESFRQQGERLDKHNEIEIDPGLVALEEAALNGALDDADVEGVIELLGEELEEDDEDYSEDNDDEDDDFRAEGEDELDEDGVKKSSRLRARSKGAKAATTKTAKPKKEPRVKRAKPLAAPRNRWGRSQNDVDTDLKALLDTPEKAQAYLASKWIDAKELHRLEELKLITYKRGKWTEAERAALREHITAFQTANSLTDAALLEIILSKGRFDKRSAYPHFWAELAEKVPGRPVKYVVTAVQRMYDPRARKGAWTAEEDEKLLTAYEANPNKWTTIANIVERTVHDCRDRWKCELRDKDKRKKGPWTDEETVRLREAVIKANTDAGLESLSNDTPWDAVVKLMGETRSRTQCRKKWQDTMGYGQRTENTRKRGSKLDARVLLSRLRELGIQHEADVEYSRVTLQEWGLTPAQVRRKWNHLKSLIPNRETLSFPELLNQIELNLKPEDWRKRKRELSRGEEPVWE